MARTSASIVLLDAAVVAASSGTKGAPGAMTPGGFYDNRLNYDSPLGITIKNRAIAPGAPCIVVIQVADDPAGPWTDFDSVSGDTMPYSAASLAGLTTKTIVMPKARYINVIAYGNTSQDVDVKVRLHAVTGL